MMGYSVLTSSSTPASAAAALSHSGLLGMCCVVVAIVGTQFYLWMSRFTLRDSRLKRVKAYVGGLQGHGLSTLV